MQEICLSGSAFRARVVNYADDFVGDVVLRQDPELGVAEFGMVE